MNLNTLARDITLAEGKKESVSIAQIKEIMKILLTQLSKETDEEILATVKRYRKYI